MGETGWQPAKIVDEPACPHATADARIQEQWPKLRGKKVRVRYWGNDAQYWEIFENVTGCDCTSFFEVDVWKPPDNIDGQFEVKSIRFCAKHASVDALTRQRDELLAALKAVLGILNNVEVLGEWEATDTNYSSRKRVRAQVDAVVADARAALARAAQPKEGE